MTQLATFTIDSWAAHPSKNEQKTAAHKLENGKVLFFPKLVFELEPPEIALLTPEILGNRKNISYDIHKDALAAAECEVAQKDALKNMLRRFSQLSKAFLESLIPHYIPTLRQGRTSFRPAEISGRKSPSYRKDDTLLHVDAFPSSPTQGERILRFFANINRDGKPRIWRVGEPFETVVEKIAPTTQAPFFGSRTLLSLFGITKKRRSLYDHYMLQIHNHMKASAEYQNAAAYEELELSAHTCWMVFTDQVSHAALAGQHVLEQTFYLPVDGLVEPSTSPLQILESYFKKSLIS